MASKIIVDQLQKTNLSLAALTLPVADATVGQYMKNDGAGVLGWVDPPDSGLTDIDQWRLDTTFSNTANPMTGATIVEITNNAAGELGSGMSYDTTTGVFTFPQTGIWVIDFNVYFYQSGNASSGYGTYGIEVTENNGTYAEAVSARGSDYYANYVTLSLKYVFDVTNTTTHKTRFTCVQGRAANETIGSSTVNKTYFTFSRVGAT
jgi:hypothetical protein